MPVGGIKEKVIAAHRAGVNEIIMSTRNEADLKDVPQEVLSQIKFHFVENINQVLSVALGVNLLEWSEENLYSQNNLIPYNDTSQSN